MPPRQRRRAPAAAQAAPAAGPDPTNEHYIYTGKRARDGVRVDVANVRVGDYVSCTQT